MQPDAVATHTIATRMDADPSIEFYSPDYFTAKRRFIAASIERGFAHYSLPIDAPSPTSEPLTIDVAIAGSSTPTTAIVVTSGMHGVEGFFGSAVQLAWLESLAPDWHPPEGAAVILIHALNPFGFAWLRRFNEDNVDLNRNFLLPDQPFSGSPPLTGAFRHVLAPSRPPTRWKFSTARFAYLAMRHGVRSFWETLPVGQYDHPDWLYFGGHKPSQSAVALDLFLAPLLAATREVVHLDFHTGLGRWANCDLLLPEHDTSDNIAWWKSHFAERVTPAKSEGRPYEVRGGLGSWLQARFPNCRYKFATAEFGTFSPLRVIHALADELRWHAKLGQESPSHWSRRRLAEAFSPRSRKWRTTALHTGLGLINRASEVLWSATNSPRELVLPK